MEKTNIIYYTVKNQESDGDKIQFRFDVVENTNNTYTDNVSTGKELRVTHTWMKPGDHKIKVYAR